MAQQLRLPIILAGHSRGGRRALLAASRLQQAGIAVEMLICIDVAFPPVVPGNVRRAVHLYRSRWRLYPARPLQPALDFTGAIENIDLDQPDSPIQQHWLHHLNITGSEKVQDWVVREITALSKPVRHI
jgi:thioesterase domain-containing protein